MNVHIKVTITNDPQKLYVLPTYRRKIPREKQSQSFCHFSFTTTFPDKIFYQANTSLQTEVKVELQINF